MKRHLSTAALLCCTIFPPPLWAGRPLATDDATVIDPGTCQLEAWAERGSGDHAIVMAPACGLIESLELDLDYTLPQPRDELRGAAGAALKWVPPQAKVGTPLGELNFGLKVGTAWQKLRGDSWSSAESGFLALATLKLHEDWLVNANLGASRDRDSKETAAVWKLALAWTPLEQALLFVETEQTDNKDVFGGTVNTVGGRWWLAKDRFGLDVTAGREKGSGLGTLWTVGFGWYGIGL